MEVMIALVIIAILAALALPAYFRTVEQSRSNEAITNLNIVHMGEKIYRLNNNAFIIGGSVAALNTALNTDMSSTFYTGSVVAGATGIANSYVATFTRNNVSGGGGTKTFTYTFTNGDVAPVLTEGGAY